MPTHLVGPAGADYWAVADPNRVADGRLQAHLPVQVLTVATGWAQVRCSNGWETWVDARALAVPGTTPPGGSASVAGGSHGAATPVDGVGIGLTAAAGAATALGGLLPWLTVPGDSVSAWDIPLKNLLDPQSVGEGLDTGPVLLIFLVGLVPLLTRQTFPRPVNGLLAGLAVAIAVLGFRFYGEVADLGDGSVDPGVGLLLTTVGGLLFLVGALRSP